jgi:6-phosphogluconolactonase
MSTTRAVFASPEALQAALVDEMSAAAAAAIAARGRFTVALTGGSAASALYPALLRANLAWDAVHVFFGDERSVPPEHPESNHRVAMHTFLGQAPSSSAQVHRIAGEADPTAAAAAAERALLATTDGTGCVDVVHLGLGPDGHVASLFPGHALLRDEVRLYAPITDAPKPPPARVTLTMQALSRARSVWFLVVGASKADVVRDVILDPGCMLPAAQVARRAASVRWLLDNDAAKYLK